MLLRVALRAMRMNPRWWLITEGRNSLWEKQVEELYRVNQSLLQLASRCRGEALKDKAAASNMKLRIQQLEQQAANDESEIAGLRCVGFEMHVYPSGGSLTRGYVSHPLCLG
jgi:uncharacterized membrane protein YccC